MLYNYEDHYEVSYASATGDKQTDRRSSSKPTLRVFKQTMTKDSGSALSAKHGQLN